MADVNYTISGSVTKDAFRQAFNAAGVTANMSVNGVYSVSVSLGTATSQISTATLSSVGLCFVQNLATQTTHTISFGRYDAPASALHETLTLRGGEAGVFRLAAGDYAAKSAVAGSRMMLTIFEG